MAKNAVENIPAGIGIETFLCAAVAPSIPEFLAAAKRDKQRGGPSRKEYFAGILRQQLEQFSDYFASFVPGHQSMTLSQQLHWTLPTTWLNALALLDVLRLPYSDIQEAASVLYSQLEKVFNPWSRPAMLIGDLHSFKSSASTAGAPTDDGEKDSQPKEWHRRLLGPARNAEALAHWFSRSSKLQLLDALLYSFKAAHLLEQFTGHSPEMFGKLAKMRGRRIAIITSSIAVHEAAAQCLEARGWPVLDPLKITVSCWVSPAYRLYHSLLWSRGGLTLLTWPAGHIA